MGKKQRMAIVWGLFAALLVCALVGAYFAYPLLRTRLGRTQRLMEWLKAPSAHDDWKVLAETRCNQAPFVLPTSGYIGFIWGDSFHLGNKHQGIDIFGGEQPGETPVLAAYDGYLTRLPAWKSTVIIRIPEDPLSPDRQIWTYYTHLADQNGLSYISPEFPPGTYELFVKAGTFLGYQGDYSGDPNNPVGVHLHFSIVLDDGAGGFRNELKIENTLDPSPYLGLPLNSAQNAGQVITCDPEGQTR